MTSESTDLGISEGLDLTHIDEITQAEIDANLAAVWRRRQPLYELQANSLMLDYAPDFAKLHRWGSDLYGRPDRTKIVFLAIQNLQTYMMTGWETGILNTFHTLTGMGVSKQQLMEVIMFSQLYSGMRGLGHVFRAVGDMLAIMKQTDGDAPFPDGWAVDNDAFKCGLDLSTREMTAADRDNLRGWYEETIGEFPRSVAWGLDHHPEFVKVNRAKWEVAIKTLPKQVVPCIMIRHHTVIGSVDGLRESVRLAQAWNVRNDDIVRSISAAAFFCTGFEGLYTAADAVDDLL